MARAESLRFKALVGVTLASRTLEGQLVETLVKR
jgi:hypothetical protein